MEHLSFDTTFLIDLQREKNRQPCPAHRFLEQHAQDIPCCSRIVMGEYAEGFENTENRQLNLMLQSFEPLELTEAVVKEYAKISRTLRSSGMPIGANDVWIAATSLANNLPLVTRNMNHFSRVPGLRVVGYV